MKRFLTLLCTLALAFCLFPSTAFATGIGNMNSGGGSMGKGTSTNAWTPGIDGVRITVIDSETGAAVSTPIDYANTVQNNIVLHFGKVSKLQWVKWHTPSTPQDVSITVSVSGATTAQTSFTARIVDLNERIPPDPLATDTYPGYSPTTLPVNSQKLTANWVCGVVTGRKNGCGILIGSGTPTGSGILLPVTVPARQTAQVTTVTGRMRESGWTRGNGWMKENGNGNITIPGTPPPSPAPCH